MVRKLYMSLSEDKKAKARAEIMEKCLVGPTAFYNYIISGHIPAKKRDIVISVIEKYALTQGRDNKGKFTKKQ